MSFFKNIFSSTKAIKADSLDKVVIDPLERFITNSGDKLVKGIEDFSVKPLQEQKELLEKSFEDIKNTFNVESSDPPQDVNEHSSANTKTEDNITTNDSESTEETNKESGEIDKDLPSSGAYVVCDGAMCYCPNGAAPMSPLLVINKKYYANDKVLALETDVQFQITPAPFVTCKANPSLSKECVYSPPPKWEWTPSVPDEHPEAGGCKILTDNAKLQCQQPYAAGCKIEIVNHGQQTTVTSQDFEDCSFDITNAICPLIDLSEYTGKTEEKDDKALYIGHIESKGVKSNSSATTIQSIKIRKGEKLEFKSNLQVGNRASPSKDLSKTNWALWKAEDNSTQVPKIVANDATHWRHRKVLSATFKNEGKFYVLAYGLIPIEGAEQAVYTSCTLLVDIVDSNKIVGEPKLPLNFIQGEEITISLTSELPFNEEDEKSFSFSIIDEGGAKAELKKQDIKKLNFSFIPKNTGAYTIEYYFEEKANDKKTKTIKVVSNDIAQIISSVGTADIVRLCSIVSYEAKLQGKIYEEQKIKWRITYPNGNIREPRGKSILVALPYEGKYKIEVSYHEGGLIKYNKEKGTANIEAKKAELESIIPKNGLLKHKNKADYWKAYTNQQFTLSAEKNLPNIHLHGLSVDIDESVTWDVYDEKGNNILLSTAIFLLSPVVGAAIIIKAINKYNTDRNININGSENTFTFKNPGIYIIKARLTNGKVIKEIKIEVGNTRIIRWRFSYIDGEETYQKYIGLCQPFKIVIEVEGWENKAGSINLWFDNMDNSWFTSDAERHILLQTFPTVKFDGQGRASIEVKSHEPLWIKLLMQKYKGNANLYFTAFGDQLPLCENYHEDIYDSKHRNKQFYPDDKHKGKTYAEVPLNMSYNGYFADENENYLKKIVKYGDPVKVVLYRTLGKGTDNKNFKEDKKYTCEVYENCEGKDMKVDGFFITFDKNGKFTRSLNTQKGYGENTHSAPTAKPRLFYFVIWKEGEKKPVFIYPDGFDVEKTNDDSAKQSIKDNQITVKGNKANYYYQLKVAKDVVANDSLRHAAMAIIGEPLERENGLSDCGGKHCITKGNYANYPNVSKENIGKLIQEINIRLAGFGGNVPTTEFDERTEATIKQFQRDYMGVTPTGKICGSLLKAIDEFCNDKKYDIPFSKMKCTCTNSANKAPQGYTACSGFGNGLIESKDKIPIKGKEYPGMHRSLLFIFRAMFFYIEKIDYPRKFNSISSSYRCWSDNKDANRHTNKKIRNTINHMGTALDIAFTSRGNKTYDDIRKDIFCKYMGAPLKRADGRAFGWVRNQVGLESSADGATSWVHVDVREFHDYKSDSFFIKEESLLVTESMVSFARTLGFGFMSICNGKKDSEEEVLNDGSRLYTEEDGINALRIIYNKYGYETARWVEQMYTKETSTGSESKKTAGISGVFTSGQYEHCGTPGMEAVKDKENMAPHYGWGVSKFFEEFPEHKTTGTWAAMEGKGDPDGNKQDTINKKHYVKMNSVLAAMEFVIFKVNERGGNIGKWHALTGPTVASYEKKVKAQTVIYVEKFKNEEK